MEAFTTHRILICLSDDHKISHSFLPLLCICSDKIITGSFDKTCKVWSSSTGKCLNTFYGHNAEIVAAEFNPTDSNCILSASMDGTARVFDVGTAQEIQCFDGHMAEVISARFNRQGDIILTGSFDHSAILWDLRCKG